MTRLLVADRSANLSQCLSSGPALLPHDLLVAEVIAACLRVQVTHDNVEVSS